MRNQGAPSETTGSTLHVLTIGISKYDPKSRIDELPYAASSARAIEAYFKTFAQSHSSRYGSVKVWDGIYDGEATLSNLQFRLTKFGYQVKPNDVVLIYFAGHGEVAPDGEMFYFIPSDGRYSDLKHTGFTTAMFADAVKGLAARRVVLLLDSCQSGGALESLDKVGLVKAKFEELRNLKGAGGPAPMEPVGVHTITAALPLSYAVGARGEQESAMAEVVLGWLNSSDTDPTIKGLERYVAETLPSLSARENGGYRQIPMISSVGADFALRP
jgi:hypothetical protein